MGMLGHRLLIGPGGSGATFRLNEWRAEVPASVTVVEVRGDPVVPTAPDIVGRIERAAGNGELIVAHDVQWLDDQLVTALVRATEVADVWCSRRPWPVTALVRALDERLTDAHRAERLAPLTADELAPIVAHRAGRAASSDAVDALHRATGGFVALACDALDAGWAPSGGGGEAEPLPIDLRDRVLRRVGRAGDGVLELLRVMVVDPDVDATIADRFVVETRPRSSTGAAVRAATAGGLLDGAGRVVPLVAHALRDDLTDAERAEVHERLAGALATVDRERSVRHTAAAASARPVAGERATDLLEAARRLMMHDAEGASELLARARDAGVDDAHVDLAEVELHLRSGRIDALSALARLDGVQQPELMPMLPLLAAAVATRNGRWDLALLERLVELADDHPQAATMARLVAALLGESGATESVSRADLLAPAVVAALEMALAGDRAGALRRAVEAADDELVTGGDPLDGMAATVIAALLALHLGELSIAGELVERSLELGRPAGEQSALRPLHEYLASRRGSVVTGERSLDTAGSAWARDELLAAASTAAVARRCADPVGLREAWALADSVLVRAHGSWLLLEPLAEVVLLGARLGRTDRIAPIIAALVSQVASCAAPGSPLDAAAAWMQLHLALNRNDLDAARVCVQRLAADEPAPAHMRARASAAVVWLDLALGEVDEARVIEAVDGLCDVEERWEAARLAGQAALDASDPQSTRRLLERARAAAPDAASPTGDLTDGLVQLGLSEREAEVARLVAAGRTHKEVGAQLYISAKTVEHHVAKIRQKLGAASRAELVAIVRSVDPH